MLRLRPLVALLLLAACDAHAPDADVAAPSEQPAAAPFVGPAACAECHPEKTAGFLATAHARTSALPDRETVLGSFEPPENVLRTSDEDLRFLMTSDADGLHQTALGAAAGGVTRRRIDVVVGSGKLGQTYLYRWEGRLLQLPVSWTAANGWVNSPGTRYRDGTADFYRPIVPRCIECHATWIEHVPGTLSGYRDGTLLAGVSCERCHGPGGEHVAWHRAHPDDAEPRAIVHPGELPQERAVEVCGQCHGGVGELRAPAFSYRPGTPLADHVALPPPPEHGAEGLHSANQLPRLMLSRCYTESGTLRCSSCHDPHRHQRGDVAGFSARCLRCHEAEACGEVRRRGATARDTCVECHMPLRHDASTSFDMGGELARPEIREHRIAVYPAEDR